WSNPLFSCFKDVKTCCVACWCPCVTYASNKSRLQYLQTSNIPHPHHGESMNGDCCAYGCLQVSFGLGWVLAFANRADIRNRYRIESTALNDLLTHWCCTPCALTQESREIELEEKFIRTNHVAPVVV
ncbi:hypothetical protein BDY24DRAFT_344007, partial [Mrakia frigida]|uniref:PLAC8 family protein n=1 Tax=Mrakia frigida TaxID=29902 RepID=UPI003FCC08C8